MIKISNRTFILQGYPEERCRNKRKNSSQKDSDICFQACRLLLHQNLFSLRVNQSAAMLVPADHYERSLFFTTTRAFGETNLISPSLLSGQLRIFLNSKIVLTMLKKRLLNGMPWKRNALTTSKDRRGEGLRESDSITFTASGGLYHSPGMSGKTPCTYSYRRPKNAMNLQ